MEKKRRSFRKKREKETKPGGSGFEERNRGGACSCVGYSCNHGQGTESFEVNFASEERSRLLAAFLFDCDSGIPVACGFTRFQLLEASKLTGSIALVISDPFSCACSTLAYTPGHEQS